METSKISPLAYLRRLERFDLFPRVLQTGILGLVATGLLTGYVVWPINTLEDMVLIVACMMAIGAMTYARRQHRRKRVLRAAVISTIGMITLAIANTYIAPRAGAPMLLVPVSLVAGLLPSLNHRQLMVMIGASAVTMIVITVMAAQGNYATTPNLQGDVIVTTIGVAIGIVVVFSMMAHYHGYMTRMVVELQEKNTALENARNTLESQVQTRTQELETQSHHLRDEIAQRRLAEDVLSQRNQELDTLNRISLGLLNKHDPNELLNELVMRACELLNTPDVSLLLVNQEKNCLEKRFSSRMHRALAGLTFKSGEGLAGRVWASGQTMRIDNYRAWAEHLNIDTSVELGALAGVPIRTGPTIIGVLLAWRKDSTNPFTDDDMDLLTRFGLLASTVHENAQLLQAQRQSVQELTQRVQSRTQELGALLNVANKLPTTAGMDAMLSMVFDQLSSVVKIDSAAIFYRHPQRHKNQLRTLYYRGPEQDNIEGVQAWPITHTFLEVAKRRQPVIIDDVRADTPLAEKFRQITREVLGDVPTSSHIASWMGIPMLLNGEMMGILTLDNAQPGYFTAQHADLAMGVAQQAALAIEHALLQEQAMQNAVRQAAQNERSRLARELHDSVSQAVFSIGLHARSMEYLFDTSTNKAREHLGFVLSLAEAALAEIRALIFELRPESLEQEGVLVALQKQATALQSRHNLKIDLDVGVCEPTLPIEIKEAIYRVSLEAIHNVVKHARASTVTISLRQNEEMVALNVLDNGLGFEPALVPTGHFGLKTMRERVEQLNGEIQVQSQPGAGTKVSLIIPLEPALISPNPPTIAYAPTTRVTLA